MACPATRSLRYFAARKLEKKRSRRLAEKLQKAGAINRVDEVLGEPFWNQRFRMAARLRWERHTLCK